MKMWRLVNLVLVFVFALSMAPSPSVAGSPAGLSSQIVAERYARAAPGAASSARSSLQAPLQTWLVTWNATATGHLDRTGEGNHTVADASISIEGSSITRYYTSTGTLSTHLVSQPFNQMVQHDEFWTITSDQECGRQVERRQYSLLSSGGSLGSEETDYVAPMVMPRPDGSYYMPFPLIAGSTPGATPPRSYPGRWKTKTDDCSGSYSSTSGVIDSPAALIGPREGTCDLAAVDPSNTNFYGRCSFPFIYHVPELQVSWTVTARRLVDKPDADKDPELLESNTYLPEVPVVDDLATGLNRCEEGTCTLIRETQQPGQAATVEQSGPYGNVKVPKPFQIAALPPGKTRVTVEASKGGDESSPDTTEMKIALVLGQWTGGPAKITVKKENGIVIYTFSVNLPKPPFQAQANVPSFIPFFGGRPFGIKETQVGLEVEGRSSGEVSGTGKASAGFDVAGGSAKVGLSAKAKGMIDDEGIAIPDGELGIKIGGTVKAERPLFEAFPQLLPAWQALSSVCPSCAAFLAKRATATLEVGPKLDATAKFHEEPASEGPEFDSAEFKPGIDTKATITIDVLNDKSVMITGSVGGSIVGRFHIPAPYFLGADLTLLTEGEVKFLGWGSGTLSKSWQTTLGGSAAESSTPDGAAPAASSSAPAWRRLDRSYESQPNYAAWTGASTAPSPGLLAAGSTGATDVELAQNVYEMAMPALGVDSRVQNGRRLLTWIHDRPGVTNGEELAFSTSPGSGQPWATFDQATGDGQGDFTPQIVFLPNGAAMALWQRFDTATPPDPNVDFPGYLQHVHIAAAKGTWNGTTWTWGAPQLLSAAPSYNGRGHIAATSTGALAVWASNSGGQILGDAAHADGLVFARYQASTNTWSAAAPVVADPAQLSGLLDVQLAASGSNAAVVYTRDMDGDPSTDADRELFYALWNGTSWGAAVRLTDNGVPDDLPQLALTSTGAPELVWRQNGHVEFFTGSWTAPAVDPGLNGAAGAGMLRLAGLPNGTLALVWSNVRVDDTRVAYAIYDPVSGLWSQVRELTPPTAGTRPTVESVAPALETGRLLIAYQLAATQDITATVDGVTVTNLPRRGPRSLRYAEVPLDTNLAIGPDDIAVTPAGAQPGEPITVTAVIRNTGQLGVSAVEVDLLRDRDFSTVATETVEPVAAGGLITVTFPYTQPVVRDSTYTVVVDPNYALHETTRGDNSAIVGFDPALTALPTLPASSGLEARARLELAGGLASSQVMTASLRLDDPEGPEAATSLLSFPITGSLSITATAAVSATQLGPGRHLLFWVPDGKPFDGSVRYAASSANVWPDLTTRPEWIDFDGAAGSSAPISLWLSNIGNWASSPAQVAVFDGDPGLPGSHLLAMLPAPAIAAGGLVTVSGTLNLAGLPAGGGGRSRIFVQIDPDNIIDELNENNNLIVDGALSGGVPPALQRKTYLPWVRR